MGDQLPLSSGAGMVTFIPGSPVPLGFYTVAFLLRQIAFGQFLIAKIGKDHRKVLTNSHGPDFRHPCPKVWLGYWVTESFSNANLTEGSDSITINAHRSPHHNCNKTLCNTTSDATKVANKQMLAK